MQDHHMLDAEPEEVPRIREFLTYIKTPEKHEKVAKFMLTMMERNSCVFQIFPTIPKPSTFG